MEKFTENGFPAISIGSGLSGNVIEFSSWIVEKAREIYKTEKKPFWFVGGGETTSRIVGKGKGGRNCELALRVMQKFSNEEFLFSSIGTDGMDGNSGAMGGIADNDLKDKVTNNEIEDSLSRSDSFSLLDKYSSAIITGFTGTNVSDIIIGYYGGPKH
jgi:glycerate 2-kinase